MSLPPIHQRRRSTATTTTTVGDSTSGRTSISSGDQLIPLHESPKQSDLPMPPSPRGINDKEEMSLLHVSSIASSAPFLPFVPGIHRKNKMFAHTKSRFLDDTTKLHATHDASKIRKDAAQAKFRLQHMMRELDGVDSAFEVHEREHKLRMDSSCKFCMSVKQRKRFRKKCVQKRRADIRATTEEAARQNKESRSRSVRAYTSLM